jgi:nitroreductase
MFMETIKAMLRRRSTRGFKEDKVPENLVDAILKAGCAAPVGMGAYNSLHLTVATDKALLNKVSDAATKGTEREGQDIFYGANTVIIISSQKPPVAGLDFSNAACVAQNMLLAATDHGLDNIYIFGTVRAFAAQSSLLKEFSIPEGFTPAASVALGYAATPVSDEKPLEQKIAVNFV